MSTQFGKYTLLRKLGDGGMAEVFLAQIQGPEGFTKLVALKRILPHLTQDETFTKSFINEARLGGYLNHHNIVQTLDFGQLGRFYYLAMEYVRGVTLADVLNAQKALGRPMPPDMALQVGLQIAEGLGYAHAAEDSEGRPLRMVHRDLKPSNILINAHGVCKIADFGVARAESNLQKTVLAGEVKGTVYYMSPEQALGRRDLDGRSDLYSLGSILFELLTNERLYPQESYLACLRMVQDGQIADQLPKVLGLDQGLHLYQLLSKLLAYDPAERPADAIHLAKEIRQLLNRFDLQWELSDYLKRLLPDSPLVIRATVNELQVDTPKPQRHQLNARSAPSGPPRTTPGTPPPGTPPSSVQTPAAPSLPGRRVDQNPVSQPGMTAAPGMTLRPKGKKARRALWQRREWWILAAVVLVVVGVVGYRVVTGGVTRVVVRSMPVGVQLSDGAGTVLGTAPMRLRVPRSGMDVVASMDGYEPQTRHLTGSKDERDVLIRLEPITGKVEIAVSPPSAVVTLDDEPLDGPPPYSVAGLGLGAHVVSGTAPGYVRAEQTFEITSSAPVALTLELEPEEKEATKTEKTVRPREIGVVREPAAVRDDSAPGASTSSRAKASGAGDGKKPPASAEPVARGNKSAGAESAAASDSKSAPKPAAAEPKGAGYLTLNAFPYAVVEIDGVRIKTTPLIHHKLAAGPHRVVLATEDGRTKELDIVISPGATLKKIVRFDATP